MPDTTAPRRRAVLEVLGAADLFGTTGTTASFAPAAAGPVSIGAARLVIGGAGLMAALRHRIDEPQGVLCADIGRGSRNVVAVAGKHDDLRIGDARDHFFEAQQRRRHVDDAEAPGPF